MFYGGGPFFLAFEDFVCRFTLNNVIRAPSGIKDIRQITREQPKYEAIENFFLLIHNCDF